MKCKSYEELHPTWKSEVSYLIKKICGKSHIAEVDVEDSDLPGYTFKVIVAKFNTVRGWATIGYIRQDRTHKWRLTYQPRRREVGRVAGRTWGS